MLAIVADSDRARREALAFELTRHGHAVEQVAALTGLVELLADEPALVVVGAMLGDEPAPEVCRVVRMVSGELDPVVVVVGDEARLDVDGAIAAGASDVWVLDGGTLNSGTAVRLALARFYARLQAEHLRVGGELALMRQALDLSGTGFVLTDPRLEDEPIVYANRSFYEMTGYGADEVIGRNCRFMQGPLTDPEDVDRIRRATERGLPVSLEVVNHRRDGSPFFNQLHIAPVRDAAGVVVRRVGVQVDVTAGRMQERRFALEQQARRAAEAAERRSAFLAAASPTLDARLDLRATLETLARLSVPHLADLCLVETINRGRRQRVGLAAADARLERELGELEPEQGFDPDGADPLARVVRQGRAELFAEDGEPVLGAAVAKVLDRLQRGAGPRRWMLVPLRARGRAIGVLALVSVEPDRPLGPEELALAEDLADRAALALDNARLYEQQRDVAQTLQSSFLPDRLPDVAGLELVTRYRPADATVDIGGDFYDVVALQDGATGLVVGDVTGKGAPAAALTGLCRHTLRTAWLYETRPAAVLGTLNDVLVAERRERGRYATVMAAKLRAPRDGGGGFDVEVVCAGHPAPRILRADGSVEALGDTGTILGWREQLNLRPVTGRLYEGDALVGFTDGVSGGNAGGPLTGEALEDELRRAARVAPAELADRLQAAAVRAQLGRAADDVVIVVARAQKAGATASAVAA